MSKTLLLADDSVTIQRVIELTFADEDIRVVAVSDGDQAIARIDSDPPDIVLVDVGMPGRNGYEVAEHIRRTPELEHIPVLLLTGAFEPVDQVKAAEAGCDGVLAKPFEPQQVIARVKELLARPRRERRPALPPMAVAEAPPRHDRTPASEAARLDSYFAQLDAAFATLAEGRPAEPPSGGAAAESLLSIDWFGGTSTPAPPEAPPTISSHAELVEARPSATSGRPEAVEGRAQGPATAPELEAFDVSQPAPLPSLSDAFAAILAAEQHEPMPPTAPVWPASPSSAPQSTGGGLPDEAMEDITRRVLERLSDRVVRETVADLVSGIAERLVKEEIERIKASIQ